MLTRTLTAFVLAATPQVPTPPSRALVVARLAYLVGNTTASARVRWPYGITNRELYH